MFNIYACLYPCAGACANSRVCTRIVVNFLKYAGEYDSIILHCNHLMFLARSLPNQPCPGYIHIHIHILCVSFVRTHWACGGAAHCAEAAARHQSRSKGGEQKFGEFIGRCLFRGVHSGRSPLCKGPQKKIPVLLT